MWLMIAVTVIWGSAGPIWGSIAAAVLITAMLTPVAGRNGYRWLIVARDHRRREWSAAKPVTVINDRQPGGVRYQNGVAISAVRVLGKYLSPTRLTGAATSVTDNVLHTDDLVTLLHQQLDLTIASISVVIHGARMRADGDFARICDTFIGPPPYAGQRETWLIIRTDTAMGNLDALRIRRNVDQAALAASQRIVNKLRTRGIRAEIATETDLVNLDEKLGGVHALDAHNRHWLAVRADRGWLSNFYYPPQHINDAELGVVWGRRYDSVTQNITLYPDGRCTATVTIQEPQIVAPPPNVVLSSLPGEQAAAVASNRPLPGELVGTPGSVAAGPPRLTLPIGNSGVLIGTLADGHRLVLPFTDPATNLRIHIDANAAIYKRLILRAAAAGERVSIHTSEPRRWQSIVMPGIVVTNDIKPPPGTTISVADTASTPSPLPATLITLTGDGEGAHIRITQSGPTPRINITITDPDPSVDITEAGDDVRNPRPPAARSWYVDMELFDVENPYLDRQPATNRHHCRPGQNGAQRVRLGSVR
jgi:type VII secretion protein EccE